MACEYNDEGRNDPQLDLSAVKDTEGRWEKADTDDEEEEEEEDIEESNSGCDKKTPLLRSLYYVRKEEVFAYRWGKASRKTHQTPPLTTSQTLL